VCLGVPCRVLSAYDRAFMRIGIVDVGGTTREVSLDLVPEAQAGDYVVVHAGFAISWLDEDAAREALDLVAANGCENGE